MIIASLTINLKKEFKQIKTMNDFEQRLEKDFCYEKISDPVEFMKNNCLSDPTVFLSEHKKDFISCVCENLVDDADFFAAYLLVNAKNEKHEIIPPERCGKYNWNKQWKYCFIVVGSNNGIDFSRYFFHGNIRQIFE